MPAETPSIRINVDPTNPGQFFACCGLLELADRLWPGAEGWFENEEFRITCEGTLGESLSYLVKNLPEELTQLDNGLSVKRIIAPLRFSFDGGSSHSITIDAWTQTRLEKNKPVVIANRPWNFWSGNQKSFEIWADLRLALTQQLPRLIGTNSETLFAQRLPLTGRFGFDPGAAWNALDVGFSPNAQQMPVASSPATEMLAVVGIQRFRPLIADNRKTFVYATWGRPLLPSAAAAASSSLVLVAPSKRFLGHVVDRGQYAALGYSTLLNGDTND